MHLLSCENPQRVYNKYINEYVWVPCGKCNTCRNAKAAKWTNALERERLMHSYCMFVTLTYSDMNLPLVSVECHDGYGEHSISYVDCFNNDLCLESNRVHDDICIPFHDLNPNEFTPSEIDLFNGIYRQFGGIPYASYSDIQYFHKRLNKWFYQNVTNKFGNFRFFTVSEFGCSTMRPHFHSIYYVDDKRVAERFEEGVRACWKLGIVDSKYVESSACSYVAQYVNKFADLPLFYKTSKLKPKYCFSKRPIIGLEDFDNFERTFNECPEDIQKIFDECLVETCVRRKANSTDFVVVPLHKSIENRLFPKCPFFKQISHSCRIELYNISSRFFREGKRCFNGFFKEVVNYLYRIYDDEYYSSRTLNTEFSDFLYECFYKPYFSDNEADSKCAFGWLRRLYYTSLKVLKNMFRFRVNLKTYVLKIEEYYNKKELWLLNKFYSFQASYEGDVEDLALMYPEYLHTLGFVNPKDYCDSCYEPADVVLQREDNAYFALSNKKTHFKNAYLDSLAFKVSYKTLFIHLKNYYHAQKCYEAFEAIAA